MFEKIPSLKDFIIYLMPGILICYFGLNIFNYLDTEALTTNQISENTVLTFVGIIFSFLIGFLSSQVHIILFSRILREKLCKMRTINGSQTSEKIKEVLVNRIIRELDLPNEERNALLDDNLIIFTCLHYVKIKTNDESQQFVNRSSNLSTFASTLYIPIILGLFNLLLKLEISTCLIVGILILSSVLILGLIFKIILNFKEEWFKSIFRQFLILSKT